MFCRTRYARKQWGVGPRVGLSTVLLLQQMHLHNKSRRYIYYRFSILLKRGPPQFVALNLPPPFYPQGWGGWGVGGGSGEARDQNSKLSHMCAQHRRNKIKMRGDDQVCSSTNMSDSRCSAVVSVISKKAVCSPPHFHSVPAI
jgi:hypothetical protein